MEVTRKKATRKSQGVQKYLRSLRTSKYHESPEKAAAMAVRKALSETKHKFKLPEDA